MKMNILIQKITVKLTFEIIFLGYQVRHHGRSHQDEH